MSTNSLIESSFGKIEIIHNQIKDSVVVPSFSSSAYFSASTGSTKRIVKIIHSHPNSEEMVRLFGEKPGHDTSPEKLVAFIKNLENCSMHLTSLNPDPQAHVGRILEKEIRNDCDLRMVLLQRAMEILR